jgi:hypothetical protein
MPASATTKTALGARAGKGSTRSEAAMTQPEEAPDGSGVSRITASERELLLPPLLLPYRTRQPRGCGAA